ncbi:MAG: sigma-54-dependent Fis family transcriptional regulator [Elusimicrobia bacterium]|nr:sigma-54-dependent Fis family transcriptional regulator [Elusimicrobiota bacterium]
MSKETILVIDDEIEILENCKRILEHAGYRCLTTSQTDSILDLVAREKPDLVFTDLKMAHKNGIEVLREIKSVDSRIPVILFTAHAAWETAVQAIKEGAFDYLAKPISAELLLTLIEKALREQRLIEENQRLKQELGLAFGFDQLIGSSPQLKGILTTVKKIASTEANILIQGESGTGKELVARAVHRNSSRGQGGGRFVPVDCASLPENLLESELFGHEKGAFTDAQNSRPGIFEFADGGTIFLDEIGEIPLSLQAKLLRVLQEKEFRRLGSNRLIVVDVRIVAATNRDLAKAVQEKKFREDLYYRLNVITLNIPPLREREGDVELLANHFLHKFIQKSHNSVKGISSSALSLLKNYSWPGNVRELENIIERAVSLTNSLMIQSEDIPDNIRLSHKEKENILLSSFRGAKTEALRVFYRDYFKRLLEKHNGNISEAAEEAKIDRKTIHRLLNRYKIEIEK